MKTLDFTSSVLVFPLLLLCLRFSFCGGGDKLLGLKPGDDVGDAFLDRLLGRLDGDLGVFGGLVGRADAGEFLDLSRAGLLVEALGVALFGHLDGHLDVDLDEGDRLVGRTRALGGVQSARQVPVRLEGRDEGCQGDGGRVGEELGDLLFSEERRALVN